MKIGTVKKQPNEKRRYGIDYSEALDPGDVIQEVSAVVDSPDLTALVTTDAIANVRVTLTGGLTGVTYKVTLTVTTTDANEIIEDELYVKVKEI